MDGVFESSVGTPNAHYVHFWEVTFKLMIIACEVDFKLDVLNFQQATVGFQSGYHKPNDCQPDILIHKVGR